MSCNNSVPTVQFPYQTPTVRVFIKQGDTIPASSVSAPNWPFSLLDEGIQINMQLYNSNQRVANYSIGNGITIDNAIKCTIDRVLANNFPVGTLKGDFQISWLDGADRLTKTFFNVEYCIVKEFTKV